MICIRCEKEIPEGSLYCNHCGRKQTAAPRRRTRGNGMGTVVKRGRTWTAIYTDATYADENGRTVQHRRWKGGFRTKAEALAFAAAPHDVKPAAPTLRDYYRGWEKSDYLDLSHSKQQAYDIAWRKLKPIADRPIDQLTIEDLQTTVDAAASTYYPARDMRTLLSHLYTRAVAERRTPTNLAEYIRIPSMDETETHPFSELELRRIWQAYGDGIQDAALVLLMIYTGMMPGELQQLRPEHFRPDAREIIGAGIKTKKRKGTPMVYPPVLDVVVADLLAREVFPLRLSKHQFYSAYYAALTAAGVRQLSPYSCRHTTATALALGNVAPSVIQEIMRHTRFTTTQRYIHPDTTAAHAAIASMEKLTAEGAASPHPSSPRPSSAPALSAVPPEDLKLAE